MPSGARLAVAALVAGLSVQPLFAADGDRVIPEGGATQSPDQQILPRRFGQREPDEAFGAFQRGLYVTALNLAKPRAEAGDAAAQTLVAEIHARGLGIPQSDTEAANWYAKAAAQGVAEAQFRYAMYLVDGKAVPKDEAKAAELMEAAALSGNRLAQFNFAQMLLAHERPAKPETLRRVVEFYERAAAQNLPDAEYAMAQVFANGTAGRAYDERRAREFLERAARRGYDAAEFELADYLLEGRGGPRDMKAGFTWMERAALAGNVAAQNGVAKLYINGLGVDPDSIRGAAWYMLAKRGGASDPFMEDHLQGLTEAQIGTATLLAATLRRQ